MPGTTRASSCGNCRRALRRGLGAATVSLSRGQNVYLVGEGISAMTEHTPTLDAGLDPGSDIRLTWWGNATVAIETGERAIVIDPYVHPQQGRFQYAFCSHEHYDHAYPKP